MNYKQFAIPFLRPLSSFILIALLLTHQSVSADSSNEEILSAGELLAQCSENSSPGAPNNYCMRYVFGLVQTVLALQQEQQTPPIFCIDPQQVPLEQATDNVIAYLRQNQQRMQEDAYILVTEALNRNYPCGQQYSF